MRYLAMALMLMVTGIGYAIDPWGTPAVLSGSMGVMARVTIDSAPAVSGDVVAAFVTVNNVQELRAKQSVQVIGGISGCLMQVFTETNGETVVFKVWDESAQQVCDVEQTLSSVVNGNVGVYPGDMYQINASGVINTVAMPTFSPHAGTYIAAQNVTISCSTPEAIIRYTSDGSEPSEYSQVYSTPITISQNTILKAKAFRAGWIDSPAATAAYTIDSNAIIDPWSDPEVLTSSMSVMAQVAIQDTPATEGDILAAFVTVNNVEQLRGKAPIQIQQGIAGCLIQIFTESNDEVLSFKVWDISGQQISTVANTLNTMVGGAIGSYPNDLYHINSGVGLQTVMNPVFNPDSGLYLATQAVNITCGTPGAQIRYTTDGSTPSITSALFTTPILLPQNTTRIVIAKAFYLGYNPSDVVTATYTIAGTLPTPSFFPPGGTYFNPQSVTIQCGIPEAQIYYTTDGTEPSQASSLYLAPINIASSTTLKARAYIENWLASDIATANYVVYPTVSVPSFNPPSGAYEHYVDVSIICSTEGAEIRYTIDGSNPTETSLLYETPLHLTQSTTVKAIAYKVGMVASAMAVGEYHISSANPDDPTVSSVPGISSLYPNPSHGNITIKLVMADRNRDYQLTIYNIKGECVYKQSGISEAGLEVNWDGKSDSGNRLPSGVYLVRFSSGTIQQTRKLVLK